MYIAVFYIIDLTSATVRSENYVLGNILALL